MTVLSPPVFTDSVDQQFFIEAQGGSQHPVSYLDRFPDTIYSKAIDSVLITFMYALLGPAGVGQLRQEYLEARLAFEDAGLNTVDLDALYTNAFAFARLAEETYELDASASLLSSEERSQILAADASFRNRAIDFLKAIRAGGTLPGLTLAARSGLNRSVELIENYRLLYDRFSDRPLNLPQLGTTNSLSEVVVLPRQDIPKNAVQTLQLTGEPVSGWFTLSSPLGAPYQVIQVGTQTGSSVITVPNANAISTGVYIAITSSNSSGGVGTSAPTAYAMTGTQVTPTSINVVYPPTNIANAGQPMTMSATGTFWAYVGVGETVPIPYNATAYTVQLALSALPVIGTGNVLVTGGPLPDIPINIQFCNALGDQPIATLLPNIAAETPAINALGTVSAPVMVDNTNSALNIGVSLTTSAVGVSADGSTTYIAPADEYAMQIALDELRPLTSFFTTKPAQATTKRVVPNAIFAGPTYTEVVRYEIGNGNIKWPAVDNLHWIEAGKEHEAPKPVADLSHQYQGFHNISGVTAYTDAALNDPDYTTGLSSADLAKYWNTNIGSFSPHQKALFPFLSKFGDTAIQFTPDLAVAASPEPMVITKNVGNSGIINNVYPVDYLGLPGINQLPTQKLFWSSIERTGPNTDYLEIDLGSTQAVNFIYFEATSKPYLISIDYDILDQAPARNFAPAWLINSEIASSVTSLSYSASNINPWTKAEIHFANSLNQMIFTRFIRLGFTRNPARTPFAPGNSAPIAYSIEVRNLRIGRNVASPQDRIVNPQLASNGTAVPTLYPSETLYPSSSEFPAS